MSRVYMIQMMLSREGEVKLGARRTLACKGTRMCLPSLDFPMRT